MNTILHYTINSVPPLTFYVYSYFWCKIQALLAFFCRYLLEYYFGWWWFIVAEHSSNISLDPFQQTRAHSINTFSWRKLPGRRKLKMSTTVNLALADIHLYLLSLGFIAWHSIKKRMSGVSGLYWLDNNSIVLYL